MKSVIILKGVSGAGKSTVAQLFTDAVICCADDYYIGSDGVYRFVADEIGYAHQHCRKSFDLAIFSGVETIVIANTNTKPSDWAYYDEVGKQNGYHIFHLVIENRHGNENIHSVPLQTLERQENAIRQNLKLR